MMDNIEGYLMVRVNDRREVVINIDHDRTGHIIFSRAQAMHLASILMKKADECGEPLDKHEVGLYRKFDVKRTDGQDQRPEQKHWRCAYFVLDLTHDNHAGPAVKAYAKSCAKEFPKLAADLRRAGERIDKRIAEKKRSNRR